MVNSSAPSHIKYEASGISRRRFLISSAASAILAAGGLSFASAAPQKPVKVGFILPEHGDAAADAKSILAGFDFFLKEKATETPALEIFKKDPGPDDGKIAEAVADLVINREVLFLIGPPTQAGTEQILLSLSESRTVFFVTNPAIRFSAGELCSPRGFSIFPNSYQATHLLAPWALKNAGRKVFITGEDDFLGNEEADIFAQGFERSGGMFSDRIMFPASGGKMKTVIDAIEAAKPDFIFATFRGPRSAAFLKALRGAHPALKQPVLGPEQLTAVPQTLTAMGKLCAGVKTLTAMKNPYEFAAAIKAKMRIDVSDAAKAAGGYDIAGVICKLISENKSNIEQADLVEQIKKMELDGYRGKIQFDANHQPIFDMMVQEWVTEGHAIKQNIIAQLGPSRSLDFGCGRVGFPKRLETEPRDDIVEDTKSNDGLWEDDGH